jgi:hypothetical protein
VDASVALVSGWLSVLFEAVVEPPKLARRDERAHFGQAEVTARERLAMPVILGAAPKRRLVRPAELKRPAAGATDDASVDRHWVADRAGEAVVDGQ